MARFFVEQLLSPQGVAVHELAGHLRVVKRMPLYFPVHPRTATRLREGGFQCQSVEAGADLPKLPGVYLMPPLGYLEFVRLIRWSRIVLTDSGGVQEETTLFGVPCATLRPNTERPVTVSVGTNELVPRTPEGILGAVDRVLARRWKKGAVPQFWDGKAAARIVDALEEFWGARTDAS